MVRPGVLSIALSLVPVLVPAASAQEVVELGDGAAVRRIVQPCWYELAAICSWWEAAGTLTFGGIRHLEVATAFGRAPRGRIVAMIIPGLPTGYAAPIDAPYALTATVLYTDDLGATWQRGDWPDAHTHALAFAFDPRTGNGVAVGHAGGIWTSEDAGASWRRRRSTSGVVYERVWLRGRTVIVEDDRGALWLSRDGGFALESLADRGRVEVTQLGLEVTASDRSWRIDEHGGRERTR
jgi:hypothetical protein